MLTGCAQDPIFSDVNRDTMEVLTRNGCRELSRLQNNPVAAHCTPTMANGNSRRNSARGILTNSPPEEFDAIITNAGGRGSAPEAFRQTARKQSSLPGSRLPLWDKKVKDIHEWLMEIGVQRLPMKGGADRVLARV